MVQVHSFKLVSTVADFDIQVDTAKMVDMVLRGIEMVADMLIRELEIHKKTLIKKETKKGLDTELDPEALGSWRFFTLSYNHSFSHSTTFHLLHEVP